MKLEVSDRRPQDFQPKMEASACYVELDSQLLLIRQGAGRSDEGQWGVPAGKLEKGETPEIAATRELFEETGIHASSHLQMVYLGALFIRKPGLDYVYYMFKVPLDEKPSICLSAEHSNYRWVATEDIERSQNNHFILRPGVIEALHYYKIARTALP